MKGTVCCKEGAGCCARRAGASLLASGRGQRDFDLFLYSMAGFCFGELVEEPLRE